MFLFVILFGTTELFPPLFSILPDNVDLPQLSRNQLAVLLCAKQIKRQFNLFDRWFGPHQKLISRQY